MASVNTNITVKNDWLPAKSQSDWMLANPWLWLGAGFALTLFSLVWTFMHGALASDGRVVVLAIGLLLGGVGVWLRWRDGQAVYFQASQALLASSPTEPLPAEYPDERVYFTITFFYNERPPDAPDPAPPRGP